MSVSEGQLANKRVPIADGKPYRVNAVMFAPPEPAYVSTMAPGNDSATDPVNSRTSSPNGSPDVREGDFDRSFVSSGIEGTEEEPLETAENASPDGRKTAIVIVVIVSVLSFSVLIAGIVTYFGGRQESFPVGFRAAPGKKLAQQHEGFDPEMADHSQLWGGAGDQNRYNDHKPPDFSDVKGPRRPGRGKRAKNGDRDGDTQEEHEESHSLGADLEVSYQYSFALCSSALL